MANANSGVIICPVDKVFMRTKKGLFTYGYDGKSLVPPVPHLVIMGNLITNFMDQQKVNGEKEVTYMQQVFFDILKLIIFRDVRHKDQKGIIILRDGIAIPQGYTEEPIITVKDVEDYKKIKPKRLPDFQSGFLRFDTGHGLIDAEL